MQTKTKKIIKISILIISLTIIFAEALYLFALPKIIDTALKKNIVEKIVEKETGLKMTQDSIKIKTRLNFCADININNLSINDKNTQVIKAKNINIGVFLPSLLFKTIEIKKLNTDKLYTQLTRDKEDNVYIGSYKLDKEKNSGLKIKRLNADINDSTIKIKDDYSNQTIFFDIKQFQVQKYVKDQQLTAYLDAQITANKNISDIDFSIDTKLPLLKNIDKTNLKGNIQNLDLSAYSTLLVLKTDKNIKSISGLINADFGTKKTFSSANNEIYLQSKIKNFQLTMINPKDSLGYAKTIEISLNAEANNNISIKNLTVKGEDWKLIVDGLINNYKNKKPDLDLNVNIPKSNLHPMYELLPSLENSNEAIQKIKKYGIWADIEGKLKIKGNPQSPDILGPVVLTNLYILKYDERIPKCRIDLDFIGQKFNLYTKVFARPNQYVEVKGTAENRLGGDGDFHISSTPVVDLETVLTLLVPIHDVVGFDLGPLPFMTLKGVGSIDILTQGNVLDGRVDGYFDFKNTIATLDGLNTILTNASGRMDFKGKKLYFKTQSGKIKNSPISISGEADLNGNIDFLVKSASLPSSELLKIGQTSKDLKGLAGVLKPIEKLEGYTSLNLKISGLVGDFSKLLDKIDLTGTLVLKDNSAKSTLSPIDAKKINGSINFKNNDWDANLSAFIFSSKFNISAKTEKDKLFAAVNSNNLRLDELLNSSLLIKLEKKDIKNLPHTNAVLDLKAEYKGDKDKIDFNKIKMKGHFKPISYNENYPFIIKSGNLDLNNGELTINNFSTKFFNTTAKFNGKIQKVFSSTPVYNYTININNFDVSSFDRIKHMRFVPQYIRKILVTYENYSGRADVNIICKNNNNQGDIKLQEIKFTQKVLNIPIMVDSGDVVVDGNTLSLKSINARFDSTPMFVNANIRGLNSNPKFNGYFTTKLTDYFVNKYINNNLTYPLKPKGDITITTEFSGDSEGFEIKPVLKLNEDADIYYMGANLGDTADKREINAHIAIKNDVYDIRKLTYLRYMTSQNDFTYPLEIISARGKIIQNKNNKSKLTLNSFRVYTKNNANVKLFNVLFKKSLLKQGMFNCNLILNGDINAPTIIGNAAMTDLDIPLYDTIIKDISILFSPKFVNVNLNAMSFDSDFSIKALIKNSTALPITIESIKISSNSVNIDSIIDSLTKVTLNNIGSAVDTSKLTEQKAGPDASDFVIKKGEMTASDIIIRGLPAQNYKASFSLGHDSILKVSGIDFEITGGKVAGFASYNFKNAKIRAEMSAKNVDANQMATAFFEVKDQIFGSLDGNAVISTYGDSEEERLKNAGGSIYFSINDGRMPKLGSLEYLLKASNLLKSGITGISINNFIQIIAPVKTGYFESIKGIIVLRKGSAQNMEIYSAGENLSLYIRGKYDFPEQNADLNVFGRLTKKADNVLGPIGNASFNSILNLVPGFRLDKTDKAKIIKDLNKIPGVEFNDQTYRIFSAKIDGDVNGEKYVTSFKWIE